VASAIGGTTALHRILALPLVLAFAAGMVALVVFVILDTARNPELCRSPILVIIERLWHRSGAAERSAVPAQDQIRL